MAVTTRKEVTFDTIEANVIQVGQDVIRPNTTKYGTELIKSYYISDGTVTVPKTKLVGGVYKAEQLAGEDVWGSFQPSGYYEETAGVSLGTLHTNYEPNKFYSSESDIVEVTDLIYNEENAGIVESIESIQLQNNQWKTTLSIAFIRETTTKTRFVHQSESTVLPVLHMYDEDNSRMIPVSVTQKLTVGYATEGFTDVVTEKPKLSGLFNDYDGTASIYCDFIGIFEIITDVKPEYIKGIDLAEQSVVGVYEGYADKFDWSKHKQIVAADKLYLSSSEALDTDTTPVYEYTIKGDIFNTDYRTHINARAFKTKLEIANNEFPSDDSYVLERYNITDVQYRPYNSDIEVIYEQKNNVSARYLYISFPESDIVTLVTDLYFSTQNGVENLKKVFLTELLNESSDQSIVGSQVLSYTDIVLPADAEIRFDKYSEWIVE